MYWQPGYILSLGIIYSACFAASTVGAAEVVDFREAVRAIEPAIVQVRYKANAQSYAPQAGTPLPMLEPALVQIDASGNYQWHAPAQNALPTEARKRLVQDWMLAVGKQKLAQRTITQSGVLVGDDGLVVTTQVGSQDLEVIVPGSGPTAAKVLVRDEVSKLVLLKIELTDCASLSPMDASAELGMPVVTLFHAEGQPQIAAGIVTRAESWNAGLQANCLSTDLSLLPGTAGAPVVDPSGALVGIAHASVSQPQWPNQTYTVSQGLVIPASEVQRLIRVAPESGQTSLRAGRIGVQLGEDAKITSVLPGGPAEKAGLEAEDRIDSINEEQVTASNEVIGLINQHRAGDRILVKVLRDGDLSDFEVVLDTIREKSKPNPASAYTAPAKPATATPPSATTVPHIAAPQTVGPPIAGPQVSGAPLNAPRVPSSVVPGSPAQPQLAPGTSHPANGPAVFPPAVSVPRQAAGPKTQVAPNSGSTWWQPAPATSYSAPRYQVQRTDLEELMRQLQQEMAELKKELRKSRNESKQ